MKRNTGLNWVNPHCICRWVNMQLFCCQFPEAAPQRCSYKRGILKICSITSAWVFSCTFAAYFQNTFSKEHLWRSASEIYCKISPTRVFSQEQQKILLDSFTTACDCFPYIFFIQTISKLKRPCKNKVWDCFMLALSTVYKNRRVFLKTFFLKELMSPEFDI